MAFFLSGICILYLKCIFYIFENFKQNCFVYIFMLYVSTKSFQEKNDFLGGI
jgi:hypothetical protein